MQIARMIASEAELLSKSGVSTGDRRKAIVFSTFAHTIDVPHERVAA